MFSRERRGGGRRRHRPFGVTSSRDRRRRPRPSARRAAGGQGGAAELVAGPLDGDRPPSPARERPRRRPRRLRARTVGGGRAARERVRAPSVLVDVAIDPAAAPGPRRLRLTTPRGAAEVPFELRAPLPRDGRFQGFSPDDVVYLIMPDRFANGDPVERRPRALARPLRPRPRRATTTAATCRGSSTACPT